MKKLSCWLGRHAWETRVEQGESYRRCSTCGKETQSSYDGHGRDSRSDVGSAHAGVDAPAGD
jgi:hypothetical protein